MALDKSGKRKEQKTVLKIIFLVLGKRSKKPHNAERNRKGDPLVWSGIVCYAKEGTTIIVQFPGPNGAIWPLKML